MTTVLMLTPWMKMGYGVAGTVAELCRRMEPMGISSVVGALGEDRSYADLDIRRARPDPDDVLDLAARVGASVVVAHGSPFFETLPALRGHVGTIAYEYGDPTPEMFPVEAGERRRIVEAKRQLVYPHVDAVACISRFIRHDIAWPAACVIPLGADHIEDLGPKPLIPPPDGSRPLRVGSLMRLGAGESQYKGNRLLPMLREEVLRGGARVDFEVMGRGEQAEADELQSHGIRALLNATDEERADFLRGIDVFVTTSQWEGCNLPLVEAQALGTPGLAFDTGAHPEFTPLVFPSLRLMAAQIQAYERDRDGLLREHGRAAHHFVRGSMSWELAAHRFAILVASADRGRPPRRRPVSSRARVTARRARASLKRHGLVRTTKHAALRAVAARPGGGRSSRT